jgi:hypothetical protein
LTGNVEASARTVASSRETLSLVNAGRETTQQSGLAPAQRRLNSRAANPTSHSGQFATRDVFPRVPGTARIPVPIPITQECVGSVSQVAGAAAGWLAALDPLADEMDPLAVLSWDMQVPKLTERPPTRPCRTRAAHSPPVLAEHCLTKLRSPFGSGYLRRRRLRRLGRRSRANSRLLVGFAATISGTESASAGQSRAIRSVSAVVGRLRRRRLTFMTLLFDQKPPMRLLPSCYHCWPSQGDPGQPPTRPVPSDSAVLRRPGLPQMGTVENS